jgi:hypothetical protein
MYENDTLDWLNFLLQKNIPFHVNHRGHRVYEMQRVQIDTYPFSGFQELWSKTAEEALSWMDVGANNLWLALPWAKLINPLNWQARFLWSWKIDIGINQKRWNLHKNRKQLEELMILLVRLVRIFSTETTLWLSDTDKIFLSGVVWPELKNQKQIYNQVAPSRLPWFLYWHFQRRVVDIILHTP